MIININFELVHFLLSLNLVFAICKIKRNNVKFINCPATVENNLIKNATVYNGKANKISNV